MEAHGVLTADLFGRMLLLERKRSERSGRRFVLMLLESTNLLKAKSDDALLGKVLQALSKSTRETDIKGWYEQDSKIGVIFTELGTGTDGRTVAQAILTKVTTALSSALRIEEIDQVRLSFRVFPEDWDRGGEPPDFKSGAYGDLLHQTTQSRVPRAIKRSMDIAGSLSLLLIGLPVFLATAVAVKLTSRGPVLFRQLRVGQFGRKFMLLKFRSMYQNSDHTIHQEYVKQFIADASGCNQARQGQAQYKLTQDPRVTRIGGFLRMTSLDELPQLLNVLNGDMSLVGPRPPLPYEVQCYLAWHKARLLAAKPGITGLWQVEGRSRVKFDDMVRMDLRYAKSWSIWLDIKILLQTPYAVVSAKGAH